METKLYSKTGKEIGTVTLNEDVFGIDISTGSIYHAIRNEEANRRVGTACTKTRAEVNYSNTKPFKQKGTGGARRGDKKSPVLVGGGTIFGPRPRDYSYTIPKKVKRLALKSLLSLSQEDGRLVVVEDFTIDSGKTKDMASVVKAFQDKEERTILIMKDDDKLVRRSCKNIPYVRVLCYDKLCAKELLYGKKIIMMKSAAEKLNTFYGEKNEEGEDESR